MLVRMLPLILLILTTGILTAEENFPQFRGEGGRGVVESAVVPADWSLGDYQDWEIEIPGSGWSQPIIWNQLVFVTAAVAAKDIRPKSFGDSVRLPQSMGLGGSKAPDFEIDWMLYCVDAKTGKKRWQSRMGRSKPAFSVHPSNTYATETPAVDKNGVYVYFGGLGRITSFSFDGKRQWSKEVGAFKTGNSFGTGSSLAFDGGRIFLQCDNQEKSFLLAINAEDGKDIWRVERSGRTCWSSPFVWRNHVRNELVVCGSGDVTGYGLDSGELLWRLTGIDGSFSASPASDDNRVYVGNSGPGRSGPLVALNAGATGQFEVSSPKSETGIAWVQQNSGPGLASPVSDGELVYVTGRGILNVYEAASGERVYRTRLKGSSSVAASPWIAGKTLYVLDESGHTNKIQTGAEFELMGTNIVDGLFWSTPSVAANSLLLRSSDSLYCVREESSGN